VATKEPQVLMKAVQEQADGPLPPVGARSESPKPLKVLGF
jgi:hypothetical protein